MSDLRPFYPEKEVPRSSVADLWWRRLVAAAVTPTFRFRRGRFRRFVRRVAAEETALIEAGAGPTDPVALAALSARLRAGAVPSDAAAVEAFARIRLASKAVLGLRHHDVQILAGAAMLRGFLAEMNTGEGKTLTATLPAITAALSGRRVHVVTVNGYLAARDAEKLTPLYAAFGLQVAVVAEGMSPADRRAAYQADIVYTCDKELAFDYLKDRLVLLKKGGGLQRRVSARMEGMRTGRGAPADLLMQGLEFVILDEADNILIDEASTPLILSAETDSEEEAAYLTQALALANQLEEGVDFDIASPGRQVRLTPSGQARLAEGARALGPAWASVARREDIVGRALSALYVMQNGDQYLIRDGEICLVDEATGRIMEDRFWSDGLHQLVELKEGLPLSSRKVTLARMSYQKFFRRYLHLCGMTGTAAEVASELFEVYRLPSLRIPTHRPKRLDVVPTRVCQTMSQKWELVARTCADLQANGAAVLVGTRSVEASTQASAALHRVGLKHEVLNAIDEARESEIVAQAGQPGAITVATNMAGRGTDIALGPGVAERGGLHVIMTERHESARVDRQLMGRAARQGDPGTVQAILSLEDALIVTSRISGASRVPRHLLAVGQSRSVSLLFSALQRLGEARRVRQRRALLRAD